MAEHCNLWRNYDDIQDSYGSVTNIMDYFAVKQDFWQPYAGPGHWNDPDMVIKIHNSFHLNFDNKSLSVYRLKITDKPRTGLCCSIYSRSIQLFLQ